MLIRRGVGDRMRAIPNSSDKREIMFSRFMPKEGRFFEHFNAHAEQMIVACEALVALMNIRNESEAEAGVHRDIIDKAEKTAATVCAWRMKRLQWQRLPGRRRRPSRFSAKQGSSPYLASANSYYFNSKRICTRATHCVKRACNPPGGSQAAHGVRALALA